MLSSFTQYLQKALIVVFDVGSSNVACRIEVKDSERQWRNIAGHTFSSRNILVKHVARTTMMHFCLHVKRILLVKKRVEDLFLNLNLNLEGKKRSNANVLKKRIYV